MLSLRSLASANALSSSSSCSSQFPAAPPSLFSCRAASKCAYFSASPRCSLRFQELSTDESTPPMREVLPLMQQSDENDQLPSDKQEEEDEEEEKEKGISKIRVSRQKYIPVSKAELLDAIVLKFFNSQDDVNQFLLLSSRLDSIIHAEHKTILEEMRTDYFLTHYEETSDKVFAGTDEKSGVSADSANDSINGEETEFDMQLNFNYGLDLRNFLGSSAKIINKTCSNGESRLAVATRFQRAFMQLLNNAQFEELSARDLMLTSALNSDYLLTLPIYVDWQKASESNAIIFRRGYATERQKGLLIVEKLDYIQSVLLQKIFFLVSKPLGKLGKWMKEAIINSSQTQEVQDWVKRVTLWLEELSLFRKLYSTREQDSDNPLGMDQLSDSDVPIWLAAQRAVSRYEGFLSPVGPRGRLLKKLLAWIGFVPPIPETPFELDNDNNASEPHLRPIFLSRISLSDIWRPATRKFCGNDLWKMIKTSFSILLSQAILEEPAFEELILLYTKEVTESDTKDTAEVPSLQLKIYEKIPIPDLPVIFPHKKLSFRIIDTVRLDAATILGLSAYFINYKFENILYSPSAIFLDVIAITALIIYVTRVALGYKQTWDRYQLLVNRTLYEKTLASGFGSVHFLLDASEQQQYKEAILTYAILLKAKNGQSICRQGLCDECERFMYDAFKAKVEMPIDKAANTLLRLGLVIETPLDGRFRLQAIPCGKAEEALKERWNSLLG
ncbi:uncharacterized protein LOC8270808 [Ricinus communis]|uniref:Uncharacterized protein n=1 Tax=Ricinus communis TaxID=3988 RepID=B9RMZ7_RICCO|nr:uncharacterized protein LOC8270808 [Ricinus communis]EEF47120.1 conserved hypothetical protein [Ricinus communis]|eukprot:XP_002515136.1 uncharacterized protein LOC8270808 [Ricinus communis]